MTDSHQVPGHNDIILLTTIASGNARYVLDLFRLSNLQITSFSNHALNWSVIQACYRGQAILLQFLLQDNARLEVKDDNGNTPLLISSVAGMSEIVAMLLAKGADVNAANNNGDTSILLASSREVIQMLLCHEGVDVNHQNVQGYTALMSAIEAMNLNKARQLILAGACPEIRINHEEMSPSNPLLINTSGENALQIAHRKGVGSLLTVLHNSHLFGQHPLFFSVVNGNLEFCNALFRYGLFDDSEIVSIRPNILCAVLNLIKNKNICVNRTEVELVTRLCQSGLNVNKCSDCDRSPLDIVMDIGNYDLAESLCHNGVIIPHQAIINLVVKENINLIPLFAVHGAVMNQLDENSQFHYPGSALDVALDNSQIGCVNVLLYHGAKIDVEYAVNQAVDNSNVKTLEYLLEECQEQTHAMMGNTPELFHRAVRIGDLRVLELLLDAGADIDGIYENKTPLMNTTYLDVINYLLTKGADVNVKSNTTVLINVLSWRYIHEISDNFRCSGNESDRLQHIKGIIDLLLKFGANLDATDDTSSTVLMKSINGNVHLDIMMFLLDKGAHVNQRNLLGQSALFNASMYGDLKKIGILLDHGAYINLRSNTGSTPLHDAVHSLETTKFLIDHNADVNAEDNMGNTPLLNASNGEDGWAIEEVLELLINSGADVNHINKDGMSALMLAAQNMNEGALSMLLKYNADVNVVSTSQEIHKSALSILLNKWYIGLDSQLMASTFLEHGANTKYVRPDTIHKIIASNNEKLVQALIVSGLFPMDLVLKKKLDDDWPMKTLSPVSVCLMNNNLSLAKYLIKNWYLTKTDINILSREGTILENVNLTTREYLKEVSTQPLRLELLSFISVSTAIGSSSDREEKVKKSGLPTLLQEYLLFKKVEEESLDGSEDFEDNLNFCLALSRKRIDSKVIITDSEFYDKDEPFREMDRYFDNDSSSEENEESGSSDTDTDNTDSSNCTLQ